MLEKGERAKIMSRTDLTLCAKPKKVFPQPSSKFPVPHWFDHKNSKTKHTVMKQSNNKSTTLKTIEKNESNPFQFTIAVSGNKKRRHVSLSNINQLNCNAEKSFASKSYIRANEAQ